MNITMKRLLCGSLAVLMLLSFAGCQPADDTSATTTTTGGDSVTTTITDDTTTTTAPDGTETTTTVESVTTGGSTTTMTTTKKPTTTTTTTTKKATTTTTETTTTTTTEAATIRTTRPTTPIEIPEGKIVWANFGDSITQHGNGTAKKNWVALASEFWGLSCTNYSYGGGGYAKSKSFKESFDLIPANTNLVTFWGSFNDLWAGCPIGEATDTYVEGGEMTLAGVMNYSYDYISEKYPNAQIVVIAPQPWQGFDPADATSKASRYVAVMKEICETRGIPFLDLYHLSGMNPSDSEYNKQYFHKSDGCHPNDEGHKILAAYIIPFVQDIIAEMIK